MILLTGASGFVGKHLLEALLTTYGHEQIVAYVRSPIEGVRCVIHQDYNAESFHFAQLGFGDIDTLIHAGSFTPKNKSEGNNEALAEQNIRVTEQLLQADLPHLKRVVYLSTLDVYAPAPLLTEDSAIAPANAYASSKRRCEQMVEEWAKVSGRIGQILRLGHVYGPGEEQYQKVIPETMRRLLRGDAIQQYGTGEELRAFIYVKDVCKAILAALTLPQDIGAVNIVGSQPCSIAEILRLMIEVSGKSPQIEQVPSVRGQDMVFDAAKLKQHLLRDEIPLRQGLQQEWNA